MRVLNAGALIGYAALVAFSALPASGATPELGGGAVNFVLHGIRFAGALALAVALLIRVPAGRRLAIAFSLWFGAFGAISLAAQIYQRLVPDGTGNYIIINWTNFALGFATEVALLVVLLGCTSGWRRSAAHPAHTLLKESAQNSHVGN
jgi:hypothetical protein